MHGIHAATSKVENSAQGSSCQLKFVHVAAILLEREKKENEREEVSVVEREGQVQFTPKSDFALGLHAYNTNIIF